MRLFVALELPAEAREALTGWAAGVVRGSGGVVAPMRLLAAEDLHLTLCFLGERPDGEAPAIAGALGTALAGVAPVTLTLGASLWLPTRRPRVLAVAVDTPEAVASRGAEPAGALAELQARVATALAAGGWFRAEPRRFLGHVTVARVRGSASSGPAARETAPEPAPAGIRLQAREVALIRSRLGEGPARYERLAGVALAGPGSGSGSGSG